MGRVSRGTSSRGLRPWLLLVLLSAFLLRAATPPGWMPNPQGALGAPLIICTADGSHLVQLDPQGHPAKPSTQRHDLCAFAGHQAAPAPETALVSGPATFANLTASPVAAQASAAAVPRYREQAPRAPPTFV
jgi:hypothetical protein